MREIVEDSRRKPHLPLTMISQTTFDLGPENILPEVHFQDPSASVRHLVQVRHYTTQVVVPVIFAFGIAGNAVNLLLLTSRRLYPHRRQASQMERSAVAGLKTLALSDLLFCLFGFPGRFLESKNSPSVAILVAHYLVYKPALIGVFQFSSTWLIVLVCVERYIAVCHPFRASALIRVHRTLVAHLFVFVASVVLNVPLFLNASQAVRKELCFNGSVCFYYNYSSYYSSSGVDRHLHFLVWFALGTFAPLALLLFSNCLLVREIYRKSSAERTGSHCSRESGSERINSTTVPCSEKGSTMRLSVTLVSVVACYLVLVCPSSLLQFVGYIEGGDRSGVSHSEAFHWAIVITNLTQTIKFSMNFFLYSIINRTFRRTFARILKGEACRNIGFGLERKDSRQAPPSDHAPRQRQQGQHERRAKTTAATTA